MQLISMVGIFVYCGCLVYDITPPPKDCAAGFSILDASFSLECLGDECCTIDSMMINGNDDGMHGRRSAWSHIHCVKQCTSACTACINEENRGGKINTLLSYVLCLSSTSFDYASQDGWPLQRELQCSFPSAQPFSEKQLRYISTFFCFKVVEMNSCVVRCYALACMAHIANVAVIQFLMPEYSHHIK